MRCGARPSTLVAACSGVTPHRRVRAGPRRSSPGRRPCRSLPTQEAQVLADGGHLARGAGGDREREALLLRQALAAAEPIGGRVVSRVLLRLGWYHRDRRRAHRGGRPGERRARGGRARRRAGRPERRCSVSSPPSSATKVSSRTPSSSPNGRSCTRGWVGDLESEAMVVGNLGVIQHLLGDATSLTRHYEAAAEHYRAHAETAARLGVTSGVAVATVNLAQVSLRLGRPGDGHTPAPGAGAGGAPSSRGAASCRSGRWSRPIS